MGRFGILFSGTLVATLGVMGVRSERTSAAPADTLGAGEPEQAEQVSIQGSLHYRERTALPPDSVAVVELWEAPAAGAEPRISAVSYARQVLEGRQVPIPFTLPVSRNDVSEGRSYLLRAAILVSGRPIWITRESIPVRLTSSVVDLGPVVLTAADLPPPRTLRCGDRTAFLRAGAVAELTAGPRRFILYPAVSPSGVRYVAGTPGTSLFAKGNEATLAVEGQQWEPCTVEPFRARGNEPSWQLEIGPRLRFTVGELAIEAEAPPVRTGAGASRYAATIEGKPIAVAVFERGCVDDMSGMPFPHAVEVRVGDSTYTGCGGEPLATLQGVEWVVQDIDGDSPARGRVTLNFGADGRAFGQGPCNLYNVGYALTGEGLEIEPAGAALKSCEPGATQQEREFHNLLGKAQRFEIVSDGALVLRSSDGRTITARPAFSG